MKILYTPNPAPAPAQEPSPAPPPDVRQAQAPAAVDTETAAKVAELEEQLAQCQEELKKQSIRSESLMDALQAFDQRLKNCENKPAAEPAVDPKLTEFDRQLSHLQDESARFQPLLDAVQALEKRVKACEEKPAAEAVPAEKSPEADAEYERLRGTFKKQAAMTESLFQTMKALETRMHNCEQKPSGQPGPTGVNPADLEALDKKWMQEMAKIRETFATLQASAARLPDRQAGLPAGRQGQEPAPVPAPAPAPVSAPVPMVEPAPSAPPETASMEKLADAMLGSATAPEEEDAPPISDVLPAAKPSAPLLSRLWTYLNEPAIEIPTKSNR